MKSEFIFKPSKQKCLDCDDPINMCICNIKEYTKIGMISAVEFVDTYVSYKEGAGAAIYQGWGYKHAQVKYFYKKFKELERQNEVNRNEVADLWSLIDRKGYSLEWAKDLQLIAAKSAREAKRSADDV